MNIKRIFTLFSVASVLMFCTLTGCDSNNVTNVDFTIDLTQPQFSALTAFGGAAVYNGIIIARDGSGNYIAVSEYCTYDHTILTFSGSTNLFTCQRDGSQFNENGNVTLGPATVALIAYHTQLTNNFLRIYS